MSEQNVSDNALELSNDGGDAASRHIQYLLNSPACIGAVMRRQLLQEMVKNLPANVQKRLNALRNQQLEHLNLEAKFYEEVSATPPIQLALLRK